jgi:carbamoyl-phosphate synthase large subunit
MGGQTALNCALDLEQMGVLEKYGVEMIGARAEVIDKAEDREKFRAAMDVIGLENPRAAIASSPAIRDEDGKITGYDRNTGYLEAMRALDEIGLPAIIRPAFTLGGTGGGVAYNREEYETIVRTGIDASPVGQVLIDESLLGWKEYEMEVVRDKADNCIIICSIENVDPMGVHTGDSITVAPALTLTDKEYQIMRDASIAVLREIGVETGGSNVQFAVNPENGRLVVIEMNPRVSRSSALASKATGFPIAKIAAKLAVGYTLDELENDITGGATPASFEPSIDYVVTKIPRFAFEKFPGSDPYLTTAMKSVGEVMAIGRTFHESLQKALRGLETGLNGLDDASTFRAWPGRRQERIARLPFQRRPRRRMLSVAQAMRLGDGMKKSIRPVVSTILVPRNRWPTFLPWKPRSGISACPRMLTICALKGMGFSDARLASLAGVDTDDVVKLRDELNVHPVFKRIDTCAAEFASRPRICIPPMKLPSWALRPVKPIRPKRQESRHSRRRSEPDRPGHRVRLLLLSCLLSLWDAGYETIMVNCNPETVSTDYDTSDRLYFEPLTPEDVLEIIRKEQENGTLQRRYRPVRRADAFETGPVAGQGQRADPWHVA